MRHTAALISAVLALGSWIVLCLVVQPSRIEERLRLETERVLAAGDLEDIRSIVNGRNVALEGQVASPTVLAEAERLVTGVAGIRTVDNRLAGHEVAEVALPTHLEIRVGPAGVSLRGTVPNKALRLEVLEQTRQLFDIDRVDERLAVDAEVEDGAALAGAAGVIRALAGAGEDVEAILGGDNVRLSGTVASGKVRQRIEEQTRAAAPRARLFFSLITVGTSVRDTPAEQRRAGGI